MYFPEPVGGWEGSNRGPFAYALGGGLDVPVALFFAWRFEGDRISAPTQSPSDGSPARFTT